VTALVAPLTPPATNPTHNTPQTVPVETEWLTSNEAARYLKVRPRTLLQWARERKVPAHRLSGIQRCVWRFLRQELDAMLGSSSADSAEGRQY